MDSRTAAAAGLLGVGDCHPSIRRHRADGAAPPRERLASPRLASSRAAQFAMLYVLLSGHRLVSMRMQLGRAGAGANAVRPSIETGLNKLRAFTTALTNFVTRSHASHNPRLRVHSRITSSATQIDSARDDTALTSSPSAVIKCLQNPPPAAKAPGDPEL